jgi:hypothetical protein
VEQQQFMKQLAVSQMRSYGSFFFWNFKTESAPMWDYFLGLKNGWLPANLPSLDIYEVKFKSLKSND